MQNAFSNKIKEIAVQLAANNSINSSTFRESKKN